MPFDIAQLQAKLIEFRFETQIVPADHHESIWLFLEWLDEQQKEI